MNTPTQNYQNNTERDDELAQLQIQLAEDLKARFQRNLEAFADFMPDVVAAFKDYTPHKTLQFFCTENGIPNLEFPDEDHRILYPFSDPMEAIEKEISRDLGSLPVLGSIMKHQWDPYGQIHFRYVLEARDVAFDNCDQEGLKDGAPDNGDDPIKIYTPQVLKSLPHCLVLGPGLGYALGILYSKVEIADMVVAEPDPDLFYASLHAFDWASLLSYIKSEKLGFNLIVGQAPEQFFSSMRDFFLRHGVFLATHQWTYVGRSDETIKEYARVIRRDFYSLIGQMGFFDDHLFAVSHGMDAALKVRHFVKRNASLPKDMRKWPLFVVGNGPSLDKDIAFLRKNQDKAVIIACGTALDTLYHAGIKPDFYAATERTPEIAETIDAIPDKEFKDSLTFIAGDVIHPKTADRILRTAIFGKPDEPFYWMWQTHVAPSNRIREIDMMNPMVGNLGVASIFGFGFTEAYLFGLDCGRRQDSMHSKFSTVYHEAGVNDKGGVYSANGDYILKANFGGEVVSTYYLKASCLNMAEVIKNHRYYRDEHFKIYNCSDGALIEGAAPLHSQDLDFSDRPLLDKKELIDYVENELTFAARIDEKDCDDYCGKKIFPQITARIRELINDTPASRIAAVQRLMTVSEFCHDIAHAPGTAALGYFLHGSIQSFLMNAVFVLYHCKDEEKALAGYDKVLQKMRNFLDDADVLMSFIPKYVLGEHYHFCNGKVGFDHGDDKAPAAPAYPRLIKKSFDDPLKKFVKRYE